MSAVTIGHERLRAVVREICAAAGSAREEAALVADHLVEANLRGHDSHGVGMLPTYIAHGLDGRLYPNRRAETVRDQGTILVLDGAMGYGAVIARQAMEIGIARAGETGAAIVVLRNAHHIGRVGAWAEQCCAAGFVSIHFVNAIGHQPLVAPFGGSDARLSTNPFCAGIPMAGGPPIVLDMATSRVALGKIRVAYNKGDRVADGTLIDAEGRPTNDPGVMYPAFLGALLPMGEHKGYGLSLVCELLAGALSGGRTNQPATPQGDRIVNNMLTIILDPDALGDAAFFQAEAEALVAWVKASPPAAGTEAVLVAGEPERLSRAERLAHGIVIDRATWEQILAAAESAGLGRERAVAAAGLEAG